MSTFTNKLRSQPAGRTIAEVIFSVVMLCIIAIEILTWWAVPVALIAGLLAARHKWPRVRWAAYFRTRKAVLPATLAAGGFGAQFLLRGVLPAGDAGGTAGTVGMLAGGIVAAAALGLVVAIIEGRIMRDIFDLVPADQQGGLRDFLAGGNTSAGQQADFTGLDEHTVTTALQAQVIGQDETVVDVVHTTFRRASLVRPNKPLAVYMLVGPTGAGKTQLCKSMASELFGGRIINEPCNQMKTTADLWSLIGSPRGYMGSNEGGKLCRDIGRLGTGVLVLDEIEKAHPDIITALMRLLDEGQITEQSTGDIYSARGFVIVATSNAAASEIGEIARVETDPDERGRKTRAALQAAKFPPEILARFDSIFAFQPLGRTSVARVIGLMVQRHAQTVGVEVTGLDADLLRDLIVTQEKGSDLGMRGLDRAVERAVLDGMLAARKAGSTSVAIRVRDGKVQVLPSAPADQAVG